MYASAQAEREGAQNFNGGSCPAPIFAPPTTASDIVPSRLVAGPGFSIVLKANGSLRSWGEALPEGDVPVLPAAAVSVSGGTSGGGAAGEPVAHGAALLADGTVLRWDRASPTASVQAGFGKMRQLLVCGLSEPRNLYGLASDGEVWAHDYSSGPQPLPYIGNVALLEAERYNDDVGCSPLLVLQNGTVLTPETYSGGSQPLVAGLPPMQRARCESSSAPSTSGRHCIGLSQAGQVWTWGDNQLGQLGDGSLTGRTVPRVVAGLEQVVAIAALPGQSLALKANGELFTWGALTWLGRDPAITPANVPGRVEGLPPIAEVATGGHILLRGADGSVWAWGPNARGELGTGDRVDRPRPTQVPGVNLN